MIVMYNSRKNKQSHICNQCKKTITCLAFSMDGKFLVTGEVSHTHVSEGGSVPMEEGGSVPIGEEGSAPWEREGQPYGRGRVSSCLKSVLTFISVLSYRKY